MRRRTTALLAAVAAGLALTAASTTVAGPATAKPGLDTPAQYEVHDARTLAKRNLVAGTGAAIEAIEHGVVTVTATKAELQALRKLGFKVEAVPAELPSGRRCPPSTSRPATPRTTTTPRRSPR